VKKEFSFALWLLLAIILILLGLGLFWVFFSEEETFARYRWADDGTACPILTQESGAGAEPAGTRFNAAEWSYFSVRGALLFVGDERVEPVFNPPKTLGKKSLVRVDVPRVTFVDCAILASNGDQLDTQKLRVTNDHKFHLVREQHHLFTGALPSPTKARLAQTHRITIGPLPEGIQIPDQEGDPSDGFFGGSGPQLPAGPGEEHTVLFYQTADLEADPFFGNGDPFGGGGAKPVAATSFTIPSWEENIIVATSELEFDIPQSPMLLRGRVYDEQAQPLADLPVYILAPEMTMIVLTDQDGRFVFRPPSRVVKMWEGGGFLEFSAWAEADNKQSLMETFTQTGDGEFEIQLVLRPAQATLTIRAFHSEQDPLISWRGLYESPTGSVLSERGEQDEITTKIYSNLTAGASYRTSGPEAHVGVGHRVIHVKAAAPKEPDRFQDSFGAGHQNSYMHYQLRTLDAEGQELAGVSVRMHGLCGASNEKGELDLGLNIISFYRYSTNKSIRIFAWKELLDLEFDTPDEALRSLQWFPPKEISCTLRKPLGEQTMQAVRPAWIRARFNWDGDHAFPSELSASILNPEHPREIRLLTQKSGDHFELLVGPLLAGTNTLQISWDGSGPSGAGGEYQFDIPVATQSGTVHQVMRTLSQESAHWLRTDPMRLKVVDQNGKPAFNVSTDQGLKTDHEGLVDATVSYKSGTTEAIVRLIPWLCDLGQHFTVDASKDEATIEVPPTHHLHGEITGWNTDDYVKLSQPSDQFEPSIFVDARGVFELNLLEGDYLLSRYNTDEELLLTHAFTIPHEGTIRVPQAGTSPSSVSGEGP